MMEYILLCVIYVAAFLGGYGLGCWRGYVIGQRVNNLVLEFKEAELEGVKLEVKALKKGLNNEM